MADESEKNFLKRLLRRWKDFRRAGKVYGVGRMAVALRAWRLRKRMGFSVRESLATGLINPALPEEVMSGRISKGNLVRAQLRLNPRWAAGLATDKAVFYTYAAGFGIPVPSMFAVFIAPGSGFTASGEILCGFADWERLFASLPGEFVVKPADACYGSGFNRFARTPEGFVDGAGISLSNEQLFRWLASHTNAHKLVIQECLLNHSSIIQMSGARALQTLRVVTYVDPDGHVEICDGLQKIIVGDNLTDNFHWGMSGNLVARCDSESGVLGGDGGA